MTTTFIHWVRARQQLHVKPPREPRGSSADYSLLVRHIVQMRNESDIKSIDTVEAITKSIKSVILVAQFIEEPYEADRL